MFYLSHNPESKQWVVQLQAGGSCGTYDSCLDRSRGSFGSSINYTDYMTGTFVASDDPAENPMFSSWNKVFVPYCRYRTLSVEGIFRKFHTIAQCQKISFPPPPPPSNGRFFILQPPSPRKLVYLHTLLLKFWLLRPPSPRNFQ